MTLFDFAIKNVLRDRRKYIYYFVNCLFSVFVFFLFSVLSFHPSLAVIQQGTTMSMVLTIGEIISVAFSILFISYSIMGFLKSRSRQFGVIILTGASRKQLNRLIFWENVIVGFLAILAGVLLGLLFSKIFLDLAGAVIGEVDFYFYIPFASMGLTILVMGSVFLLIAYMAPVFIRKEKIIRLVKAEMQGEKPQKLFLVSIIFCLALLATAWGFLSKSPLAKNMVDSQIMLLPFGISFVLSIYLVLSFGLKIAEWVGKKKGTYYIGTNLLFFAETSGSKKANCIGMTMTAILYALSFIAMTILLSQNGNVKQETEEVLPFGLQHTLWDSGDGWDEDISFINSRLALTGDYRGQEVALFSMTKGDIYRGLMSNADYNKMMLFLDREEIVLQPGQVYLVSGNAGNAAPRKIPETVVEFLSSYNISVSISGNTTHPILLSGFTSEITVINDEDFKKISDVLSRRYVYVFDYEGKYENSKVVQEISKHFEEDLNERRAGFVFAYDYYTSAKIQSALTLYIGAILSFAFIVAVASFVFSRLYGSLLEECKRLSQIVRMGLSRKEISKILSKTVRMYLLVPFSIALLFLWAAVFVMERHVIISIVPDAFIYTIVTVVAELVFYTFVRRQYEKKVFEELKEI